MLQRSGIPVFLCSCACACESGDKEGRREEEETGENRDLKRGAGVEGEKKWTGKENKEGARCRRIGREDDVQRRDE